MNTTIEFGMFSEKGDLEVARIVDLANRAHLNWTQVTALLQQLSNNPDFAEAMDTVVRERVWESIYYK